MTDQLPSEEQVTRYYRGTDSMQPNVAGDWVLYSDYERLREDLHRTESAHAVVMDSHKWLFNEKNRLETALRGISTCSTCEACRGAAMRALGIATESKSSYEGNDAQAQSAAGEATPGGIDLLDELRKRLAQPPGDG